LIEAQNKAWQKCLTLLTEMNTLMFEKYKSADLLLEDHPPVRSPAAEPVTVGAARQPQPFNNYSDTLPYDTFSTLSNNSALEETGGPGAILIRGS